VSETLSYWTKFSHDHAVLNAISKASVARRVMKSPCGRSTSLYSPPRVTLRCALGRQVVFVSKTKNLPVVEAPVANARLGGEHALLAGI
jgi:hypothetical protein